MIIPTGIGTRFLRRPWLTYSLVAFNVLLFLISAAQVKRAQQSSREIFQSAAERDPEWFHAYFAQDCLNRSSLDQNSCNALGDVLLNSLVKDEGKLQWVDKASTTTSLAAAFYLDLKGANAVQLGLYEYSRLSSQGATQMSHDLRETHKSEGVFSVLNQNWWVGLKALFLHAGTLHLVSNMLLLLVFGSLLEQKVSRFFFVAIYITGGFLGLLPMVSYSKDSLSFFVGNSGCIAALMGAAWVAYRGFKIRCVFLPLFPTPILARSFMVPVVWALPALYFLKDLIGLLSNQTGTAFDAHLIGVAVGALAVFYDTKSSFHRWPWISSREVRLYEESRRMTLELRLKTLRQLALSNFSNYRTWTEWARVAVKYGHDEAICELATHLYAQIMDHSQNKFGARVWIRTLSAMKDQPGFEKLFAKLISVEVLGIAERAIEQENSELSFRLLTLGCLKKDLHWIVNAWIRKLKQRNLSPRFKELSLHELDRMCLTQDLPLPLKKFHELLLKERTVHEQPLAA